MISDRMTTLAQVFARVLSQAIYVPMPIALEIVTDLRLMNEDIDCAFEDERGDPESDARKLYQSLTSNPDLMRWLDSRITTARQSLEGFTS